MYHKNWDLGFGPTFWFTIRQVYVQFTGPFPGKSNNTLHIFGNQSLALMLWEVLCSWDKSLNIGSHMLRIFLKVPSFTFDSLNHMQQIRSYSFYILVIWQNSFIFLMMFWIIWLCVCYNQSAKGIILRSDLVHYINFQKLIPAWHDLMRGSCLKQLAAFSSNGQM